MGISRETLSRIGFRPDGVGKMIRLMTPTSAPNWATDGLSITLPHPGPALRPNSRVHYHAKARAVAAYRALAAMEARMVCGGNPPRWERATVEIVWSATGLRHPDPDNIVASLKAAFDGMQDAGIVRNDKGLWPERPVILTKQPWAGVRLTVRRDEQ